MSDCLNVSEMADLLITAPDYFAGGDFENPITWHKRQKLLPSNQMTIDPLFDNIYRKSVTLDQYGTCDHPEYIKWKLIGHNLVICHEYVSKGILDKASEIIDDTENLLKSIERTDLFLKSIKVALDHVIFSMKGHVLRLCSLKTKLENVINDIIMPIDMNNVNKAGLFGIQALYLYYGYGFLSVNSSKDCLLKAISLNDTEPEWYFLIAKIAHDASMNYNYVQFTKLEFEMSKKAVEIGNKVQHKLYLVNSYYRMSKLFKIDENTKNQYSNARLKLINETVDNVNDLLLFKSSLNSLSNIDDPYGQVNNIIEILINKLGNSNCGYVHNIIGKYYLNNIKDFEKARFHLKKAVDGYSFYGFYDYINTLIKIDGQAVPVEIILADMLKKFPHPVHQQKILSQIVSYIVITKRDIIAALNYIQMLLRMKNITNVNSLQKHKMQFNGKFKTINLLDVLSEKLNRALNDQTLSTHHFIKVTEVLNDFKSFELYVSKLIRPEESNVKIKFSNNEPKNLRSKDEKQSVSSSTNVIRKNYTNRENWRTLKPNYNPSLFNN